MTDQNNTKENKLGFSHGNIDGDHAVDGVLYESPYNKDSYAAFTFANGRFSFGFNDPSGAIREAAEKGGSGFMQFGRSGTEKPSWASTVPGSAATGRWPN